MYIVPALIWRVASHPSITGNRISMRIRSGCSGGPAVTACRRPAPHDPVAEQRQIACQHLPVRVVTFNDQDLPTLYALGYRKTDCEGRALSRRAPHIDVAAHQCAEALAERQPEAGAAVLVRDLACRLG